MCTVMLTIHTCGTQVHEQNYEIAIVTQLWESGNTKNLFSFSITLPQFFKSWVMKIENRNQTKQLQLMWVSQKISDELWKLSDKWWKQTNQIGASVSKSWFSYEFQDLFGWLVLTNIFTF